MPCAEQVGVDDGAGCCIAALLAATTGGRALDSHSSSGGGWEWEAARCHATRGESAREAGAGRSCGVAGAGAGVGWRDLLQEPLPIMEFGQFHRLYTRARFLDSSVCAIFRGHLSSPLCVTRCPAQWHNHHCHFLPFGRLLRLSISNFGAPGFLQCVQFRTCFAFP